MYIANQLYKFNDHRLPENFISIAVQISDRDKIPVHAALLIRHKKIDYLYHFPGSRLPLVECHFNKSGWHIYKILDSFNVDDESEISSVLQHCKRICDQSKITYSYILDGSRYDDNGNHISKTKLPELGTCVGFCINTLNNILIDVVDGLLCLDDWDNSNIIEKVDQMSIEQVQSKYPSIDWTEYNAYKKRVTPLEFLCISYFNEFPIHKSQIEEISNDVQKEILSLY